MNIMAATILCMCFFLLGVCITLVIVRYFYQIKGRMKINKDAEMDGMFMIEFSDNPLDIPENGYICFKVVKD